MSGNARDPVTDPTLSPLSPVERFRDVSSTPESPGPTVRGVLQWTESGGARIVQSSDYHIFHETLARTYFQDEGRLLGYVLNSDHVLIRESSTSQTPAEGDKEWLLEAIKGTPLEDKIVIVE